MPFLLHPKNEKLWDDTPLDEDYDPFIEYNASNPAHVLMFTQRGLRKWIFSNSARSGVAVSLLLMPVWERCVTQRLITSRIPFRTGPKIGEGIREETDQGPIYCSRTTAVQFVLRNLFSAVNFQE
jgi:hypothetical protein